MSDYDFEGRPTVDGGTGFGNSSPTYSGLDMGSPSMGGMTMQVGIGHAGPRRAGQTAALQREGRG